MMVPQFAGTARALAPALRLARVAPRANPDATAHSDIRGIRLPIPFRGGRDLARLSGARPAADIAKVVRTRFGETA